MGSCCENGSARSGWDQNVAGKFKRKKGMIEDKQHDGFEDDVIVRLVQK